MIEISDTDMAEGTDMAESTNITDGADGFVFESYPQRVLVACIFLIVFITGTIGNSLTILAVLLTRKLQNATNTFVINLAVSDLLACIFIPWSSVGLLNRSDWPEELGFACSVAGAVLTVSVGCSFYTLASIALNRLVLITCSKHTYHMVFSAPALILWVLIIWAIPFCVVILPPTFGIGALGFNPKYKTCSDISVGYHENASQNYDYIQAAGVFPVPLIVLLVSYCKILHYVWSHSRKFVTREVPISHGVEKHIPMGETTATSSSIDSEVPVKPSRPARATVHMSVESLNKLADSSPGGTTLKRITRMSRREMQVTKNLFILFCAFMLCLLPYVICLVIDDTDPATPYAVGILLVNSCLNPIIYAVRFPNFKMVFKSILKCQWYSIPEPSWLLRKLKCDCGCCSPQYN